MKSYQLLLLSNHILRIFFLFSALIITINTKQAEDIHHSSVVDFKIHIDKFKNQNSKNHDTGNYHQLVSTIAKSGLSKKFEDLVTDEGFILTALKQQQRQQRQRQRQQQQQQGQQQNENEKGVNNEGNSAVATTTATTIIIESANSTITDKQNLSIVGTNFIDFSYPTNNPVNKEISLAIHSISNNSNLFQSLINQSIRNDNNGDSSSSSNSKDSSSNIKWKFLNQRMINLNDGDSNHRRKRWATDDTSDKDEMNKIFDTLSSTNYDSPTSASDEMLTSSDYHIHDIGDDDDVDKSDNTDDSRFRIPVENIVIMGSDADADVDDSSSDNNEMFKGTTFDEIETTDSYEQMNSVEETEKDDENMEMGIVRIAPEILPKDSIENLMEPTMHQFGLEAKTDEIMDEKLLKSDIIGRKNHMGKEDEIDWGTIQEMRISDDPNDAAIACDDET
ncbi:unnamed protein product, partial [Brugia timori]|uniref:Dentin sialophosphoprotein-like n=1 Tax=Brugia timori TaxID=42155 RepID=A0A0R3R9P5_9BILA